jgi:hypothetical protein
VLTALLYTPHPPSVKIEQINGLNDLSPTGLTLAGAGATVLSGGELRVADTDNGQAEAQETKPRRERSPNYPGITLETALERAQRLWDREKTRPARVDLILKYWGYSPKSGGGLVALAALKKFGLIEDEGSGPNRQAKLSGLALRILRDRRPGSVERAEAIREAALFPSIHREIWERFGEAGLPLDEELQFYLEQERGFTEGGAREFIQELRSTLAFAGVEPSDTIPADEEDSGASGDQDQMTQPPATMVNPGAGQTQQTVPIPVPVGAWPVLTAPKPMSDEDWEAMLDYLKLMRPAFVKRTPEPARADDGQEEQG